MCPKGNSDNAKVVEETQERPHIAKSSAALGPAYVFEDGATYSFSTPRSVMDLSP